MAASLTDKIRYDYGTVSRFCRIHGIKWNTFKVVAGGHGKSKPISDLLIKEGYIKRADELKRAVS
jgi:hypothetical protein